MKIGFLFPGQGAQNFGMGKDLYEKYEEYKKVYDEADKTEKEIVEERYQKFRNMGEIIALT